MALGLSMAACSSSSDAAAGGTGGADSGAGPDASTSTGGKGGSTGGASSTGGKSSTGGAGGAGGAAGGAGGGTGGTGTGGTVGADSGAPDGCVPETLTPPTVAAAIQTPSGLTLTHHLHATGTQIYTCTGTAVAGTDGGLTYAWVFKAPDAKLSDSCGRAIATHFAGPTWQSNADGSTVKGAKVAGVTVAATAVPWLLLSASAHTGSGMFSSVTYIQRVDTTGGIAPTAACAAANANADNAVPYTADYYFYTGP
jgi:hypothetical protein